MIIAFVSLVGRYHQRFKGYQSFGERGSVFILGFVLTWIAHFLIPVTDLVLVLFAFHQSIQPYSLAIDI